MWKLFFLLQFLLIGGCQSEKEGELLGKNRDQILAYLSRSHYKFHDSLSVDPSSYTKEEIQIKNLNKWNSETQEYISVDSTNRVVFFIDYFMHIPSEENKTMGMKKEDRDKALEEISDEHGKPELIKKRFNVIYHWEDSLNIYEFFGDEAITNDYFGYFTGETKEYRTRKLSMPFPITSLIKGILNKHPNVDSFLNSLPDSLLHKLDTLKHNILLSPFVK